MTVPPLPSSRPARSFERPLRLTGRSSSHFTRVVRMVAHELGVPLELDVLPDILSLDGGLYGGHPALKIPTLQVDGVPLFGTDNLCRRLAELAGRAEDPRVVLTHQVSSDLVRNAQELVFHSMATQVQLVVGLQVAKLPADNPFFAKLALGLAGAASWLDGELDAVLAALPAPRDFSIFEVTLFCLLEHMRFRPTLPLTAYPRLTSFAATFAERPSARETPFFFDPPPVRPTAA